MLLYKKPRPLCTHISFCWIQHIDLVIVYGNPNLKLFIWSLGTPPKDSSQETHPVRIPPEELLPPRNPSNGTLLKTGFLPKQDSFRYRIPLKTGFLPKMGFPSKLEAKCFLGGILFLEEYHFGRNSILGGILFWEESCFERNPVLGGILFWEESHFGRNHV